MNDEWTKLISSLNGIEASLAIISIAILSMTDKATKQLAQELLKNLAESQKTR